MNLDWNAFGAAMGSWILTYLLHTTVLLSGAALAAILLRSRPELEEAIWKLALVGGLLTASLQPAVADWMATGSVAGTSMATLGALPQLAADSPERAFVAAEGLRTGQVGLAASAAGRRWLFVGWAAVTLLLLVRLATASFSLRRRLAGRRTVTGPLARLVDRLLENASRRRKVRLTRSEGIPVPIALGGEICLPERALRELPPDEQETVVAHEMAHVLRRDPAWLLAGRILGACFFFHPLVLLAGRRLRRVAELRCDDWAADVTGRPLDLASCLTRVAGWGGEVLPAAAMAGEPSRLAGRVTRLLDRKRSSQSLVAPRWLRSAAAIALAAVVLWLPGISLAGDTAGQSETAAEAPPASEAPRAVVAQPRVAPPAPVVPPQPRVTPPQPVVAPVPSPRENPLPVVATHPPVRPAFAIPAPEPLDPAELAALEAAVVAEVREVRRVRRELIQRERLRARERGAESAELRQLAGQRDAIVFERQEQRELARQLAEQAAHGRAQARLEMERLAPELERLRNELQLSSEERERLRRELEVLRREVEVLRSKED